MVDELDDVGQTHTASNGGGRLPKGRAAMFVSLAIAGGLGFMGGMLIGQKQGEARGLVLGLELGRAEATPASVPPRTWRRFWRREAAA